MNKPKGDAIFVPTWTSVACGIPGYDMSALQYARHVQNLIAKGELVQALFFLQDAKKAEMLHRMSFAIQEDNLTRHAFRALNLECEEDYIDIEW